MIFKTAAVVSLAATLSLWAAKAAKAVETIYTWCIPTPIGVALNLMPWPMRGVALSGMFSAGLVGLLYLDVLKVERQSYVVILLAIAFIVMVQEGHVTRMLTADKTISSQLNAKQKNFIYSGRLALVLTPVFCEGAFYALGMEPFLSECLQDAYRATLSLF